MRIAPGRLCYAAAGVLIVVVAGLAGCAGLPPAQLHAYTDAFTQAQDASDEIYRAMIPALLAGDAERASGYPVTLGPEAYDRSGCDPQMAAFAGLQARCAAFAAIRSFNQALLDLHAGASVSGVQAELGGLQSGAATLVSLVSIPDVTAIFATAQTLFPALETIARELALAADRAALKARFDQARPLIEQLLTALQNDVPQIHQVMRAYYNQRLTNLDLAVSREINPALKLADIRSTPDDAGALVARQALDTRFEAIFAAAEPAPSGRLRELKAKNSAAQPFNRQDAEKVDTALDAAEPVVMQFRDTAHAWHNFREAMGAYDAMLVHVRDAFAKLAATSKNPFTAGGGNDQLLESALAIREQASFVLQQLAASH